MQHQAADNKRVKMHNDQYERAKAEYRERKAEQITRQKMARQLIKIGYKELTKFGTTAERARDLKTIRKRLKAIYG
jgi:hypothetical protein